MATNKTDALDLIHLHEEEGLSAPLVKFEDAELQLKVNRFLPSVGVAPKKREMVNAIFDICERSKESITSLSKVSDSFGLSVNTIRSYLKELEKLGVVETVTCTTDPINRRRGMLYVFKQPNLSAVFEKLVEEDSKQNDTRPIVQIEDVDLINQHELTDIAFCDLITTVLFGALRFNRKGNATKIESHVLWGPERVAVETRSGKGERIALLFDLKYYIGTITVLENIIKERIKNDELVTETYNIPLNAILNSLRLPKTGGHKNSALTAIRRLSGTTFHIRQLPKWFLHRYGMTSNSALHLNMLTLRVEGESSEAPGSIVLQLQFPPETIAQIKRQIDGNTEAIHELTRVYSNALTTSNSLVFGFNLWTSNYFSEKGMAIIDWLELKDRTAPQLSITEFKKSFSEILKNHAIKASVKEYDQSLDREVEVIDVEYESIYNNQGIALKETSCISGIRVSLEDGQFVLLPEIDTSSLILKNLYL
ncbi:hypothetical protein P3602_21185 [Vibrio parahaemolyticus]|uniref:hypothetical protein n=1 Tax=Vibrio TaxID=662 RepID=UPI001CDC3D19|nr:MULTISPECIES: hypothetical protein [Vibrio]MDF5108424.1 hypothetical protein [Vibrio parahaemolyticus]MCA2420909.1 hypothetical protein [Vibrio alginolyticus]MCA2445683.1 hypothetical protein [Vibrio alginolyticus]MDF5143329.1 hypothetical protein [Vibrio parahaemolyticus]MDF5153755.1 hypothetical protein [Vibrio parahaemolyticus]